MKYRAVQRMTLTLLVALLATLVWTASTQANWPSWRGPDGTGVAPRVILPSHGANQRTSSGKSKSRGRGNPHRSSGARRSSSRPQSTQVRLERPMLNLFSPPHGRLPLAMVVAVAVAVVAADGLRLPSTNSMSSVWTGPPARPFGRRRRPKQCLTKAISRPAVFASYSPVTDGRCVWAQFRLSRSALFRHGR